MLVLALVIRLLVLHRWLSLRRRGTSAPALLLWAELILHRYVVAPALHVHHVGSILEGLGEIAYMTDDVMIALKGERHDRLRDTYVNILFSGLILHGRSRHKRAAMYQR